jgi:tetratricopeptide (TPR) repeat protein
MVCGVGDTGPWGVVAQLALALLADDPAALEAARAAAGAFPADPYVQFEAGLASARRDDFAAAAQAFDRCADARPRFAYAYYHAALAYARLDRNDLAVVRLETFQRLAPQAPERPEVEALLRTVR